MSFSSARRTEPEIDRCGNAGSPERDMSPGEYGVTAYAEVHLAFDFFLVLQLFLPVEIGLVVEHD